MSIKELISYLNYPMEDGYIIKSIHLYSDRIHLTLVNSSHMKTLALSYEQFYDLFGD